MSDHHAEPVPDYVPHYTGSLDAGVPDEHIVCIQYDESSDKWIAINRNERGILHVGVGNTEVLARRIAGLKAYAGRDVIVSAAPATSRQDNLADALDRLAEAVEKSNEYRAADPQDQQRQLAEIRSYRHLLRAPGPLLAAVVAGLMGTLTYLITKFADGLIGKLAEVAAKYLKSFLSGS